jgi:hypothetical protein
VPSSAKATANPTLDSLKLPAGAIMVLCEQAQQALTLIPRAIVLAPDEYQKLMEQIEQLKRQLKPDKIESPSVCRLSCQVEEGVARIQAKFEFKTQKPATLINLGCQRSWPTAATLDDRLPYIQAGPEGYLVEVDQPGTHRASLELVVPISSKGTDVGRDQGLDLDLPRSAITTVEQLSLPAGLSEIKIGNFPIQRQQGNPNQFARLPLGSVDRFQLTWKGQATQKIKGPSVSTATGHAVVRVDQANVITDAELTLQVLRGVVSEWQIGLQLPADGTYEIKPHPQDEPLVKEIIKTAEKTNPIVKIIPKEPGSQPLRLIVRLRQPSNKHPLAIEMPRLINALSQRGDVEIRAPENIRLRYEMGNGVGRRTLSDDERREGIRAAFSYWSLPGPAEKTEPLVWLEIEPVKGAAESRTTHLLRMVNAGADEMVFQARTRIDVTPVRAAIDHIQLALPNGYHYDKSEGPSPVELVEDLLVDASRQNAVVKLAQKQTRPFSITIAGSYTVPKEQARLVMDLPRATAWGADRLGGAPEKPAGELWPVYDRGGQIKVSMLEGLELVARQFRLSDTSLANPLQSLLMPQSGKPATREYLWQGDRMPERLELAWEKYRPELSVRSTCDLMLSERQGRLRQRMKFESPQTNLAQSVLRLPSVLSGKVQVISGGTLQARPGDDPTELLVNFTRPGSREQELDLEYGFSLPDWDEISAFGQKSGVAGPSQRQPSRRLAVPLVQPLAATRGETKIRVWCDAADQPAAGTDQWEELPTEIVAGRDTLPALVLHGGLDNSLALVLSRISLASTAVALIDRILIRVDVSESGLQSYRSKFLVDRLSARQLDVDLPAVLPRGNIEARLGANIIPCQLIDEAGKEIDVGKKLRLRVPTHLVQGPAVLEIRFEVDSSRVGGNGTVQSSFYPPRIENALFLGRLRWEIHLPRGWMVLRPLAPAAAEQKWEWSGWSWSLVPVLSSSDLEQWIGKSEASPPSSPSRDWKSGFVFWQVGPEPLQVIELPERIWLLACSLFVLAMGFFLLFVTLTRWLFWSLLVSLGVGLGAIELLWPGIFKLIVFGSQPGLFVLVLVFTIYAALHHRYRRRVVVMPSFTRMSPGSSITRSTAAVTKSREATTGAEPPKPPSKVSSGVGAGS